MSIAAPGDMAVVIDLSRLVSAGRQAKPGADRAGPPEVRRILDGSLSTLSTKTTVKCSFCRSSLSSSGLRGAVSSMHHVDGAGQSSTQPITRRSWANRISKIRASAAI